MKKYIGFCFCFLLLFRQTTMSQNEPVKEKKRSFAKKEESLINLYYGLSVSNSIARGLILFGYNNIKYGSFGPVGLSYEYVVRDGIGLGAEFSYATAYLSFTDVYTNPVTKVSENYTVKVSSVTYRAFARANFHVLKREKDDLYFLVGLGFRKTDFTLSASIPEVSVDFPIPNYSSFGFKPGLGYRRFFNKSFGLHAELALGTPYASAGLSFKIR